MLEVERLLADCLHDVRTQGHRTVPLTAEPGTAYAEARRTFLTAGLRALRDDLPESGWTQLSLAPGRHPLPDLYRRLAAAARALTGPEGPAGDFFFLHKPPGLRIRFRAAGPEHAEDLRAALRHHFTPRDGDGEPPVEGVYEPEVYLFGGPRAMPWVHALFTADSLAWLDHHAGTGGHGAPPPPDWRVSLTLLRAMLDGLGVVGWEHRGVWTAVREETGRRLPDGLTGPARQHAAAGVRGYWRCSRDEQLGALPAGWRDAVRGHAEAVQQAAERWRAGYFESGDACTGPRRAAAFAVIFHWNRGRFSVARQALLTEALAEADTPFPAGADTPAPAPAYGKAR
ncbi:thiopeptide-type bacteriocin biosynthesis protein [Streptomyces sp. JJ36]|uniref:thiopeptide-type bacteriocin biosynthesis protein n=1 Tax=Streptomyces sp. JJ36 TaxID=2736645 RepID=UPI001F3B5EEF|nr:thiopeptide-type bacteriocin biosynthesis protein [Streptomyces sp. JJ36]MCF6522984.1 hypothetical protein [Streptomyces sp. JJ36]